MLINLKLKLARMLINTGIALLPEEARTQTTIKNMMLTRMIKGVTLDLGK